MNGKAQVHPSHYMDVPAEIKELKRQIGALKTENSTLKSELGHYQSDPENVLLSAAGEFLKQKGADVLVIGGISVRHQPEERRFNHELVIRFTGTVPELES